MMKLKELLFLTQIKGFGKVKINRYLGVVEALEILDHLFNRIMAETNLTEEALITARNKAERKYDEI